MSTADFILKNITKFISDVDTAAAAKEVEALRLAQPDLSAEALADQLIRAKCKRAGAVGAVTSGAAVIPGLGTVAAMTFGVAADIGMTFKLQAELVLEIAHAFGHELAESEKQQIILTITGVSAGSQAALQKVGQQVATKASASLAQKSLIKALPYIGVAASAGTNVVTTYIIGRRALAYFSLGPDKMGDWKEGLRAVSGINEQHLVQWLGETTESSWQMLRTGVQTASDSVIVASQTTGTAVVVYSKKAASSVVASGGWLFGTLSDGVTALWPFKTGIDVEGRLKELEGERPLEEEKESDAEQAATLWGRLFAGFGRGASDEDQLAEKIEEMSEADKATLADQMVGAEITGEKVIGLVGAGQVVEETPAADKGYFGRVTDLFRWGSVHKGPDADSVQDELLTEIDFDDLPDYLLVIDEEEGDATAAGSEKSGMLTQITSFFKRETGGNDDEWEEIEIEFED